LQASDNAHLIEIIRNLAIGSDERAAENHSSGASVGAGVDAGVGVVPVQQNVCHRLEQSQMRLSTLLEATHLTRQVDALEQQATLLEAEVRDLRADLAAEDAVDAAANAAASATANAAVTVTTSTCKADAEQKDHLPKVRKSLFSRLLSFTPSATKHEGEITQPCMASAIDPQAVSTVAMGLVKMPSNDIAAVMPSMIQIRDDHKAGDEAEGEGGFADQKSRTTTTIESTVNVVKLRKKVAKAKAAALKVRPTNFRLTVIDQAYELHADDMVAELKEDELEALEDELFDHVNAQEADNAELPILSAHQLPIRATLVSRTQSESIVNMRGAQDRFTIAIRCGLVEWEVFRYGTDFLELKTQLFRSKKYEMHGASMPRLCSDEDAPDSSNSLAALGEWLDDFVRAVGPEVVQELGAVDEFFEAWWHIEQARKLGPPQVDLMKYLAMSREQAEAALLHSEAGTYLLRHRIMGAGDLVLSVSLGSSSSGLFWHGIIEERPPQAQHSNWKMKGTSKLHNSLKELLDFHKTNPFSRSGGRRVLAAFLHTDDESAV
jgi:hypothetical protein